MTPQTLREGDPIPFFDNRRQYEALSVRLDAAITRVLHSGGLVLDREVRAFEEAFAGYCGATHGVGVNSGTDALRIALSAAGVGRGHEVITVPNTSVGTVSVDTNGNITGLSSYFDTILTPGRIPFPPISMRRP